MKSFKEQHRHKVVWNAQSLAEWESVNNQDKTHVVSVVPHPNSSEPNAAESDFVVEHAKGQTAREGANSHRYCSHLSGSHPLLANCALPKYIFMVKFIVKFVELGSASGLGSITKILVLPRAIVSDRLRAAL